MGHADAGAEGDLALGLHGVELGQDAAGVRGERGQHLTVTGSGESISAISGLTRASTLSDSSFL